MPPKKKTSAPTPVEAITHGEKRANLPTADNQDFLNDETEKQVQLRYPRDTTLDPQLVWKGKDTLDGEDLVVDAPPIFIQEKIDPRVLIENLRDTALRPEDEPELSLFDDFDGLDELEQVEFYQHAANWSNRMILGDSLQVMASLAEREGLRGQVQMVYIDPPYGIKFGSNWQVSINDRTVKDGKLEDIPREAEAIRAFRDTWEQGIHTYLAYLRDRLVNARDLLTESGSCFVQIGDENAHLVRSLLDEVFGSSNYVRSIQVVKTQGATAKYLASTLDTVLWYAVDHEKLKFRRAFLTAQDRSGYTWLDLPDGTRRGMTAAERRGEVPLPAGARVYQPAIITSQSGGKTTQMPFEFEGREYRPGSGGWKTNSDGLRKLALARRIHAASNSIRYVRFDNDFPFREVSDLWTDTGTGNFTEEKVYVVQTSTKIVQRCMLLSTDPGDLVIDPTCGSGTTAFVAEQWGRRWITIDSSRVALAIARQRLMGARFPYYLLADSPEGRVKEAELVGSDDSGQSTTGDIRMGFVNNRARRITLRSIATNPDIVEGMDGESIMAAIDRFAETEVLFDRPFEDPKRVRVSGPFTAESLSPHRSVSFREYGDDGAVRLESEETAEFSSMILENLRKSGIQNGRRQERLEFDSVEPHAGPFIHAVGIRDAEDGPKRVAISVGPRYATVGSTFVKEAAREANKAKDVPFDLLCVLSYAFDPMVVEANDEYTASPDDFASVEGERKLGKVPVLLVRMNTDLEMGDELKKTGAGNLFMVFGEPDVDITADGDQLTVNLNGVDVYDPNSKQIRSNDTDQIALWMIDTNYNGESFFVRHCYFTGGQDPYKKLKTALKTDIDKDAWDSLYRTVSRPFARPETGKIAVKVINDYGDEVVKVFEV
jgi:adenine-specific DNA-methyltransferase